MTVTEMDEKTFKTEYEKALKRFMSFGHGTPEAREAASRCADFEDAHPEWTE
jgi:hypothetical protein